MWCYNANYSFSVKNDLNFSQILKSDKKTVKLYCKSFYLQRANLMVDVTKKAIRWIGTVCKDNVKWTGKRTWLWWTSYTQVVQSSLSLWNWLTAFFLTGKCFSFKLDCKVNGKCVQANETYRDGCSIKRCYWRKDGNIYSSGSEIVEFGKL